MSWPKSRYYQKKREILRCSSCEKPLYSSKSRIDGKCGKCIRKQAARHPLPNPIITAVSPLLEPPIITLSGIHGSCYQGGFYSPEENKILLASGIRYVKEDEAEFYIWLLNHELAHWATLMFLSPVERTQVLREYDIQKHLNQGETRYHLLEAIAYYASGVR